MTCNSSYGRSEPQHEPAREATDSYADTILPPPATGGVVDVPMPQTDETVKHAITVTIEPVRKSRMSSTRKEF